MKILIAPDSYKGSLPAAKVAEIIARAGKQARPGAEIVAFPLADGGEGTVDCVLSAAASARAAAASAAGFREPEPPDSPLQSPESTVNQYPEIRRIHARVHDPIGRRITADYGAIGVPESPDATVVIEMAAASGLPRLAKGDRDLLRCNTYGTGEMIEDAVLRGYRNILLGIGGSATNDGGMGMASALGVRFLDASGTALAPLPENFSAIQKIDRSPCDSFLKDVTITVLCDVTNPLLGPDGATRIFGPQKSGTPEELDALEQGLSHYADIVEEDARRRFGSLDGQPLREVPGAGAAGGLGFGLLAFCHPIMRSGIDGILDLLQFDSYLQTADLVITGEGRIDGQTANGKACLGIARRCQAAGVPCVAICGDQTPDADSLLHHGLTEIITLRGNRSMEDSILHAPELLFQAATEFFSRLS